ncbi:MAG: enoyl-CoA hydratase-related protein, partial [Bacilli bacterium]
EPDSLNALSISLKQSLIHALLQVANDRDIKIVVLSGKGKAFCAGGDIKAFGVKKSATEIKRSMEDSIKIIKTIQEMKKPVIAAVHGYAAGAGFSIALAADLIIAEEGTKFGLAFKNVGLIPDLGGHYFLPKVFGYWKAKELIWKGATITAEEAERYGFINRITPKGQLYDMAQQWAEELASGPTEAFAYSKSIMNQAYTSNLHQIFELENHAQSILRGTIDHQEGVQAFLEKRSPRFIGE